jgi:hypothetical protein
MKVKYVIGSLSAPFALSLSKRINVSFDKLRTNGGDYQLIFLTLTEKQAFSRAGLFTRKKYVKDRKTCGMEYSLTERHGRCRDKRDYFGVLE